MHLLERIASTDQQKYIQIQWVLGFNILDSEIHLHSLKALTEIWWSKTKIIWRDKINSRIIQKI